MDEEVLNIIKEIIIPIITLLIPLITSVYNAKRNVPFSFRKYRTFKKIRKDYLEDRVNGYYFFQEYIGIRIPKEQIDFILNSENAFSIIKIIKAAAGKYDFKDGKFYSRLKKRNYIIPFILYFISALSILIPIAFRSEILGKVNLYDFILSFIFILCIFGPILIISVQRISEISSTRYLETLTRINSKKRARIRYFSKKRKITEVKKINKGLKKNLSPRRIRSLEVSSEDSHRNSYVIISAKIKKSITFT